MRNICIYCGSNPGKHIGYIEGARSLVREMTARKLGLVYGGASVGIMGAIADTVLQDGGNVIGVIPQSLVAKEIAHQGLSELRVVATMHERKALMADLADGFIALPGGLGTIEEIIEVLTWAQLGFHSKPCGLLNLRGYFDGLSSFLDHAVRQEFMRKEHRSMLLVDDDPQRLLDRFESYRPPPEVTKWIERQEI